MGFGLFGWGFFGGLSDFWEIFYKFLNSPLMSIFFPQSFLINSYLAGASLVCLGAGFWLAGLFGGCLVLLLPGQQPHSLRTGEKYISTGKYSASLQKNRGLS